MRLDGIGGTVTLSDHAKKIHESTGQKVKLVTRGYEELFDKNPHVAEIINVGMRDWKECSLIMRNQFNALAEIRFGIGKWHSQNGSFPQNFSEFEGLFEQFPINFRDLAKYNLHHVQLADKTLGLPYEEIESEVFDDETFDIGDEEFILVNNGVDVIHQGMRQTKCWNGWNELVELLEHRVIQAGTLNDPVIVGAEDLRGDGGLRGAVEGGGGGPHPDGDGTPLPLHGPAGGAAPLRGGGPPRRRGRALSPE